MSRRRIVYPSRIKIGDVVTDVASAYLGLPEKVGIAIERKIKNKVNYFHVVWIGYTNDEKSEGHVLEQPAESEWMPESALEVLVSAINE